MHSAHALLLDLDGTLIDSKPGIIASMRTAMASLGHPLPDTMDLTFAVGPPVQDVMARLLAPFGDTLVEEAVLAYRSTYGAGGIYNATVYPGIPALLGALQGRYRLFLATAKRTVFARQVLEHFGLAGGFTTLYGSEPDGSVDHKPELIARILDREGLTADETIMVGDRSYDITGAHANRVRAIGVLWGYGGRAELEQAGADDLVDSTEALGRKLLG